MITRPVLQRDLPILACAISAGIHAALVPEHLEEGRAAAGGFAVSAVLLGVLAIALTYRVTPFLLLAGGALMIGLLVSYALAITTGVPILHPDVEPVEGLALFTKAVEIAGPSPGLEPGDSAEQSELLTVLRGAIDDLLTDHQRRVLVAIALNGVPIDVLADRLGTTRNALYKTLHDARRKLRLHLDERGLSVETWLEEVQ